MTHGAQKRWLGAPALDNGSSWGWSFGEAIKKEWKSQVRESDQDLKRGQLRSWFSQKFPAYSDIDIDSLHVPTGGGNSAETFFATLRYKEGGKPVERELVVRRQLEGQDLFLKPDLNLPYRMMEAMAAHSNVPVPPVLGIEFDRSFMGTPFLIMEAVPGKVIPQMPNYNLKGWLAELPPQQQKEVWYRPIDAMAEIHKLNWREGFEFLDRPDYGRPGLDQYFNHMMEWYRWAVDGRPNRVLDAGIAYLTDNRPSDAPVCVLWGDSHANNILFHEDNSLAAIIDWEAAGLGTPEVDFGYWLFFDYLYAEGQRVKRLAGLPSRAEMTARYETALGRKVQHLDYYEIMGAVRFAIVLVRFVDRMLALGRIPETTKAASQNPATHILAGLLGIEPPGDISDFIAMNKAAVKS